MPSLIDITPATQPVTVGDHQVHVCGLSARTIGALLKRFPGLLGAAGGGTIDTTSLMEQLPDAIPAIIAAGMRATDETRAEFEEAVDSWGFEHQFDALAAILSLTFPSGITPFFERFGRLVGAVTGQPTGSLPVLATDQTPPLENGHAPSTDPATS